MLVQPWVADWLNDSVCVCACVCVCVCVCVCQRALGFPWLIRCPCAEPGYSADSSQLARRGLNESHGDARRMTTDWATHRKPARSPPAAQHAHTHTHTHTHAHRESFRLLLLLLPCISWLPLIQPLLCFEGIFLYYANSSCISPFLSLHYNYYINQSLVVCWLYSQRTNTNTHTQSVLCVWCQIF